MNREERVPLGEPKSMQIRELAAAREKAAQWVDRSSHLRTPETPTAAETASTCKWSYAGHPCRLEEPHIHSIANLPVQAASNPLDIQCESISPKDQHRCEYPKGHSKIRFEGRRTRQVQPNEPFGYDHGTATTAWMDRSLSLCGDQGLFENITCSLPEGHTGDHYDEPAQGEKYTWPDLSNTLDDPKVRERLSLDADISPCIHGYGPGDHHYEAGWCIEDHGTQANPKLPGKLSPPEQPSVKSTRDAQEAASGEAESTVEEQKARTRAAAQMREGERTEIRRLIAWRKNTGKEQCSVESSRTDPDGVPTGKRIRCALWVGHGGEHYRDPDEKPEQPTSATEQGLGATDSPSVGKEPSEPLEKPQRRTAGESQTPTVERTPTGKRRCKARNPMTGEQCIGAEDHIGTLHGAPIGAWRGPSTESTISVGDPPHTIIGAQSGKPYVSTDETVFIPARETDNPKERDMRKTVETSGSITGPGKITTAEIVEVLNANVPSGAHPIITQHSAADQRDGDHWSISWTSRSTS